MASYVDLTENDVPGAKLVHKNIEEHTNIQLKRWLKCRGLVSTGKRNDLIERCRSALKSEVKIDPGIDSGKWHELKKVPTVSANQVPFIPISGWKKFPSSSIPKHFNNGHIYHYLVESITSIGIDNTTGDSASGEDDEQDPNDVHTSKPFTKGKNLFRSGHVKDMQNISQKGHYFVKSTVLASYSQRSYSSTVTISENSGMIRDATCTCSAAGLGRCAHVAAILFALEDFISEFGTDVPTCTEKLCAWNKGRRKNKNPAAVYSKQYPSMKKELKKIRTPGIEILKSDPRPEALRQDKISKEDKNAFVSDLNNLGGECGWTTLLDFVYDDFTVEDYGTEILKTQCEQFHFNLKEVCTDKQGPFQLDKTVGQSDSKEWMLQRKCRVTASVAKDVACIKTGHTGVLKRILYTDSPLTPAIIYGQENEKKALESYIEKNPQYTIDSTGLWINPKYPGLGCSPDGIFNDTQSTTGLIEIKCPYVLKNVSPCMAQKSMTMKEEKNLFCTFQSDGTLRLKRNHKYYYQIQMQLAICEQKVCDFVIWSQHGMSVERIQMDESFWNHTYPKLLRFHKEYLVPEYFLMRIPRELESAKFEY